MTAPADSNAPKRRPTSAWLVRIVWGIAALYLLAIGLGAGLAYWTDMPSMCTNCHELQPSVTSWQTSPHARVGCPMCHEPVRPWFRFPETFAFRAQMLKRDSDAHNLRPEATTLDTATISMRPIPEANCLQCHDLTRAVTLPPGLVMDHAKHVARNKSCVSCHRWTAHPPPAAEAPLLLMSQCFNCHGRLPGSKAPGTCTLCHPKSLPPRPQSHTKTGDWLQDHGKIAKVDRQPCAMCHDDSFCRDCHRIDMPHPAGWVKDGPIVHSTFAQKDVTVCEHCHGPAPNLCNMCHHKGLASANAPWASNHAPTVDQRGAAFCFSCHDGVFCNTCHGRPGGPKAPPTSGGK